VLEVAAVVPEKRLSVSITMSFKLLATFTNALAEFPELVT